MASGEYVGFDFDPTNENNTSAIDKFLKIYVNFNKDMTLFFNYNNYMRSPYIRLDGNEQAIDIIDGTYLKLKKGENGILNMVVQFKYMNGDTVYGYKNATIVSYKIYNVSDDKPKFVVSRVSSIQKDSLSKIRDKGNLRLTLPDLSYDIGSATSEDLSSKKSVDIDIQIKSDNKIDVKRNAFVVDYPQDILEFDPAVDQRGYSATVGEDGTLSLRILSTVVSKITLHFKTVSTLAEMQKYVGSQFMVYVDGQDIYDVDGYAMGFVSNVGSIEFIG